MIESFANLFLSRIYTVRLFRGINVSLCEIHLDSQWCNGRFLALSAVEPFDTKRSSTVFLPLPKTDQVQSARSPLDKTKDSEDVPALQLLAPARCFKRKCKGGGQFAPPFEGIGQDGIAAAQFLQIVGGIGQVCQRTHDVGPLCQHQ